MIKKLCTIFLSALLAAPLWAQPADSRKDGVVFAPRKGQWQVSLVLGSSGSFYNENTGSYLLPQYNNLKGEIGLPNGGTSDAGDLGNGLNSGDLNAYLNINGFNNNSLVNIVGLQAKYFVDDCWSLNFSLGMNVSVTPKKDFIEGDYTTVPDMIVPDQKYVNAQTTSNWYVNVGTDRYFKTSNTRIHPYIGVTAGFQMARIETMEPYTGKMHFDGEDEDTEGLDQHVYLAPGKVGQMFGIKGALVGGIEYSVAKGMILGLECQPLAYRYDVIQIAPQGFGTYTVSHHNIKLVDMPVLKLGFRF